MVSIVIPTRERRNELMELLGALEEQATSIVTFEVIVVVDGSGDDTAAAVRGADVPFHVRVIEQARAGAAAARNAGALASRGEVLLFLDDDVSPAAALTGEAAHALSDGGDFALPRIVLHEGAPDTLLARDLRGWLEEVHVELGAGRAAVGNIMSAALAVRRGLFHQLGGFDEDLSLAGRYGAEDAEFGHRLLVAGASFRYLPDVEVRIQPEADPKRALQRAADVSRGHVLMIRRHPELLDELFGAAFRVSHVHRVVAPVVLRVPSAMHLLWPVRVLVVSAIRNGRKGRPLPQGWWMVTSAAYWRGVALAGGAALAHAAWRAVRSSRRERE
jgi:glycosyl transferase family 2